MIMDVEGLIHLKCSKKLIEDRIGIPLVRTNTQLDLPDEIKCTVCGIKTRHFTISSRGSHLYDIAVNCTDCKKSK